MEILNPTFITVFCLTLYSVKLCNYTCNSDIANSSTLVIDQQNILNLYKAEVWITGHILEKLLQVTNSHFLFSPFKNRSKCYYAS